MIAMLPPVIARSKSGGRTLTSRNAWMTFEREPLEALTIIWKLAAVKTFWVESVRFDTTGVLGLGVSVEVESSGAGAYWLAVTIWMVRVVWLVNPLMLAREIVK